MIRPDALTHGTAILATDVRLHYVTAGSGPFTVVLIHGYPQHWWAWRHVMPPLVAAGFHVVAVDYRGAGKSTKPNVGYDKQTMARDVHTLLREHLKLGGPLAIVGHDIGSMVAYAFARQFAADVGHLSLSEAPLPGTLAYDSLVAKSTLAVDPLWHFRFHNAPNNLAESLTAGRERLYLDQFYDGLAFDAEAIDAESRTHYAEAFASAGAMRAGFELYRAFDQDAAANRTLQHQQGKLTMPVLAMAGELSPLTTIVPGMMSEVAKHATIAPIPRSGHWIAEENPRAVADALIGFLKA